MSNEPKNVPQSTAPLRVFNPEDLRSPNVPEPFSGGTNDRTYDAQMIATKRGLVQLLSGNPTEEFCNEKLAQLDLWLRGTATSAVLGNALTNGAVFVQALDEVTRGISDNGFRVRELAPGDTLNEPDGWEEGDAAGAPKLTAAEMYAATRVAEYAVTILSDAAVHHRLSSGRRRDRGNGEFTRKLQQMAQDGFNAATTLWLDLDVRGVNVKALHGLADEAIASGLLRRDNDHLMLLARLRKPLLASGEVPKELRFNINVDDLMKTLPGSIVA